jgi:formylglycine-generating enzyme required for sulfatase activity
MTEPATALSGGLVTPELLRIPGGSFVMGDDTGRVDERPAHQVRLAPFRLARCPVTNREYACYLAAAEATPPRFWEDPRFNAALQPVVGVSWFEAIAYCDWLSRAPGSRCRLPTEAEHEWAALGGRERAVYPWGDEVPPLIGPWALGDGGQDRPVPVSSAQPNGYGLCHMQDNVHEWCSDWYDAGYYGVSPDKNPRGPALGSRRSSRGGAWRHQYKFSRIASRSSLDPAFQYNDYGFRVAADA